MEHYRTHSEALVALQALEHTLTDTAHTLHQHLATQQHRLDTLTHKLNRAQLLVNAIASQPKRANTVYSAAKYPANKATKDQFSVLHTIKLKEEYQPNPTLEHPGALRVLDHSDLFVRLYESGLVKNFEQALAGIGHLPEKIDSVTNLLLFNSNQNPYKKYSSLDNLDGSRKVSPEQDLTEEIFSAPQTIIDGSILVRFVSNLRHLICKSLHLKWKI
jgi:WAS family protein 1